MAIHESPRNKNVARCTCTPKARIPHPGRAPEDRRPGPGTEPEQEAGTASRPTTARPASTRPSTTRRPRRVLLAVEAVVVLLIAGAVLCVGLACRQLAIPSPVANAYVGLAGVCIGGVGACVPVYLHLRRRDPSDD